MFSISGSYDLRHSAEVVETRGLGGSVAVASDGVECTKALARQTRFRHEGSLLRNHSRAATTRHVMQVMGSLRSLINPTYLPHQVLPDRLG